MVSVLGQQQLQMPVVGVLLVARVVLFLGMARSWIVPDMMSGEPSAVGGAVQRQNRYCTPRSEKGSIL